MIVLDLAKAFIRNHLPHGIIGVVLMGIIAFGYHAWYDYVYNQALTQFNEQQVQQQQADDARYADLLKQYQADEAKLAQQTEADRQKIDDQAAAAEHDAGLAVNRGASDLLKHTVDQLRSMSR
jgi:hypothetical protein